MFCSAVIGALQLGQAERGTMRLNVGDGGAASVVGIRQRRAFGAQLVVHHHRHAIDHDIQEAADQQAQHDADSR